MNGSKPLGFMRRRGIEVTPLSPSPRPSPSRRGRRSGVGVPLTRWDLLPDWMTISLSLRERGRVRGNSPSCLFLARQMNPGIVELRGSSGKAGAFPRRK